MIPVAFSDDQHLSINMATARMIGVSPPWAILNEAVLVQEERQDIRRKLNLSRVMTEAVRVNLDLEAKRRAIASGEQEAREAGADLLPHLHVSASALYIDEDRAKASFGQRAERTYGGSLELRQILFSEPVWANRSIQKRLQKGRELELEELRLEIKGIVRGGDLRFHRRQ